MLEESISGHYLNDLGKRVGNEMYFVRFKLSGRIRFCIQVDFRFFLIIVLREKERERRLNKSQKRDFLSKIIIMNLANK